MKFVDFPTFSENTYTYTFWKTSKYKHSSCFMWKVAKFKKTSPSQHCAAPVTSGKRRSSGYNIPLFGRFRAWQWRRVVSAVLGTSWRPVTWVTSFPQRTTKDNTTPREKKPSSGLASAWRLRDRKRCIITVCRGFARDGRKSETAGEPLSRRFSDSTTMGQPPEHSRCRCVAEMEIIVLFKFEMSAVLPMVNSVTQACHVSTLFFSSDFAYCTKVNTDCEN